MRPRPRRRCGAAASTRTSPSATSTAAASAAPSPETDNIWFTCLTLNTNSIHFDEPYAARTQFGQLLVNSTFTLALVIGLTVPDTSENAAANLAWTDIKLPKPVFVGDTL